jgi:hypothetical protein
MAKPERRKSHLSHIRSDQKPKMIAAALMHEILGIPIDDARKRLDRLKARRVNKPRRKSPTEASKQ